ncbi:MAG: 3-isopropylmalate dehydratase small subunit [Oscillospiraceae bacterium]|jgi:3-isopropylmalate/(R)-2-methylmalate dehydratase small subunit|nr:3-isopropylmalate dehydratase small subunit [Oscillospiraceae bacterium]
MPRAFVYGDNVDTDVIIPARYLALSAPAFLREHCMEDIDPQFSKKVREGDFVAAGVNFGCGSSREHAPLALKACGVRAVIAVSFARIFYRNAVNIGLTIAECPHDIRDGDELELLPEKGEIYNKTSGKVYRTAPFPPFIARVIDKGGLMCALK